MNTLGRARTECPDCGSVVQQANLTRHRKSPKCASVRADVATNAATTREQYAAQVRNSDVRDAVRLLGHGDGGRAALSLMTLSLWQQCQTLGLQDRPTLHIGASS